MRYTMRMETPIGEIWLCQQGEALVSLGLPGQDRPAGEAGETPLLREATSQLAAFFAGARSQFDLPLDPRGTDFQRAVWAQLLNIPAGQTRSYGDIARAVGKPQASRAVGGANNKNPLPILIPCHRVVGANGALVGYGGGLSVKERLLALEAAHYRKG